MCTYFLLNQNPKIVLRKFIFDNQVKLHITIVRENLVYYQIYSTFMDTLAVKNNIFLESK